MSLRLENISVSFGKHKILHEINLQVETGCFFSLLGPSRRGKKYVDESHRWSFAFGSR